MDENYEEIELYYEHKMREDERILFEEKLAASPELQKQVRLYESTRKGVSRIFEERRIKTIIEKTENDIKRKAVIKRMLFPAFPAAATIALFLFIAYNNSDTNRLKLLAEKYNVEESPLPIFMGGSTTDELNMSRAMHFYSGKDYTEALKVMANLAVTDTVLYYSGICKLNLNQNPVPEFKKLMNKQLSPYSQKAGYYLLIYYMKSGNKKDAETIYRNLLEDKEHPYRSYLIRMNEDNLARKVFQ